MTVTTGLLHEAAVLVTATRHATAPALQRHLRVTFPVALRLLDELTAAGICGPSNGTIPRDVLMTTEQAERALRRR